MKLYRQKIYSDLERDIVKKFLGVLSGFIHKAKVLHWAASGKDIHEYLDDFWKEIYEFQDTVAEGYMGIMGQLDNDIVFKAAESDNPWEFVREVEAKTVDFYNLLPDDSRYKGLSGETESFIQEIEKYKYLFSLCSKNNVAKEEGQKEFSKNKRRRAKFRKDYINNTGITKQINPSQNPTEEQLDRYIRANRKMLKERSAAPELSFAYAPTSRNLIERKINAKAATGLSGKPLLEAIKKARV